MEEPKFSAGVRLISIHFAVPSGGCPRRSAPGSIEAR